jgi:hypothetical protein
MDLRCFRTGRLGVNLEQRESDDRLGSTFTVRRLKSSLLDNHHKDDEMGRVYNTHGND